MNDVIDEPPTVLRAEIEERLRTAKPIAADISELKRQLRSRHAIPNLKLKPQISSEEILEGFFRCVLAHYLHQRFELHVDAIPNCINSSHKAVRRVCVAPSRHRHYDIADAAWASAWARMQVEHPEVNIRVPNRRSPRRADLYIVAGSRIVSLEFKYIGTQGLKDAAACVQQVQRHAARHAGAILVVYSGAATREGLDEAMDRLSGLDTDGARIVGVHGPGIPAVGRASA